MPWIANKAAFLFIHLLSRPCHVASFCAGPVCKHHPLMTLTNLDTWLKAAADNKITAKNTWDAPIIDHFSNIEEFRGSAGINFQKATTTLDGCMKVYSTRVDTVMDDTFKLLESLNSEEVESAIRQGRKRGAGTLERNASSLNLKDSQSPLFVEPSFFKCRETVSIFNVAKVRSSGILVLREEKSDERLNLAQYPASVAHLVTDNAICPTLNEINPDISQKLFAVEFEPERDDAVSETVGLADNFEVDDSVEYKEAPQKVEVTTFGYMRDWAGPGHWRARHAKKKSEKKARERVFVDFFEVPDAHLLYETGDTLIKTGEIVKRRNERQALPEDFRISPQSLYGFLVRNGSFKKGDTRSADIELRMQDMSIRDASAYAHADIDNDLPEEIDVDLTNIGNQRMSKKLLLNYRRTATRVDIRRLQENVLKSVAAHKSVSLKTMCREVPSMYEKRESDNISVHYCVLSLLFLAHESSLEITGCGPTLSLRSSR